MADTLTETLPQRKPWLFTKDNARAMQAKAIETKRAKRLRQEQQRLNPPPQLSQDPNALTDPFHNRTLSRVRAQMSRLLSLAEKESDPAKLDRLAAAFAKHEEVERRLSDRSLPAVRRVQDTPKSKASRLFG